MDQNLFDNPINKADYRKKVPIPFYDVGDIEYSTRQDPIYIASISNNTILANALMKINCIIL